MLEFGKDAELAKRFEVLLAAEGGAHAGEVADRSDLGAQAASERLTGGGAAQIVVATASAFWLGDDLELADAGLELENRAAREALFEREVGPLGMASVEVGQSER